MAFVVEVDEISARFPRELTEAEVERLEILIADAIEEIEVAFARRGRSFTGELATVPWLDSAARKAVREMVSAAVLIGENVGLTSASSATGQVSDSVGFRDTLAWSSWGGVKLTDDLLRLLGLRGGLPSGRFPRPIRWPERRLP